MRLMSFFERVNIGDTAQIGNIVNFSTLPKFKTSLLLVDLSKFLKYQLDYLFIRTVVSVLCEPYCPCLPIAFHLMYLMLFVILAVLNK